MLMRKKLTARQRSILEFVIRFAMQNGYPPSIREIGAEFEIRSLRGVTNHLDALEAKGFIRRDRSSRGIKVLHPGGDQPPSGLVSIPILGTIAAGAPLLAIENREGELMVPRSMLGNDETAFALHVRGDSMVGAHILPGDIVVIRPQETADDGDLVAALIGDEATVKRLRLQDGCAMLAPANPAYDPIPMAGKDCRLIGRVIGLLRNY